MNMILSSIQVTCTTSIQGIWDHNVEVILAPWHAVSRGQPPSKAWVLDTIPPYCLFNGNKWGISASCHGL